MNLRAIFLARHAVANADGTFDVEGGGVTDFRLTKGLLPGAPIRLQFAVVLRLEVGEDEVDQLRPVDLTIVFDGHELGPPTNIPLVARRVPGETLYYQNVIMNMLVDVPRPGAGHLRFSWDGGLTAIPPLHFTVDAPTAA